MQRPEKFGDSRDFPPFMSLPEGPEGGQNSTDLLPMNEIYNLIKGGKSVTDFLPFLLQYIHSSSPEGVRTRLTSLRQVLTTLEGIVEKRDENVVGILFVLYRFGFIYKKLVWLKGGGMKPQQFYETINRFLSFGFIRKLSKQEKYHNTLLRRIYLKRKGRPSWSSLLGDKNFEKLTAYAPTEPFRDFLTLVFEKLQIRPPEWAVKLVSEYAHMLTAHEDPSQHAKEVEKMMALQTLEEKLPEIVDVWLRARASNWRDPKLTAKWQQYQKLAEDLGLQPKEFMDMVFSYARKELGVVV